MKEEFTEGGLRNRLIIAGIEEISLYGIKDFSLRRVAMRCDASCAAPYRHFKNREDFIREIVSYINRQWELLCDSVISLFEGDVCRQLTELSVAYIRFLAANANYRAALSASGEMGFETPAFASLLAEYCKSKGMGDEEHARRLYAVKALIFGTVSMLGCGELQNEDATFEQVRATVRALLA
ncbi:MAG: TetR/AcrR family transcriptional regulator [Clostridia bacterium]|nr:TetR/AcrR family transcriptional regulator [Clostridia bacterium]